MQKTKTNTDANKLVDQISNVESTMLPPRFRSRVRFSQRFMCILIVFFIAIALGVFAFTMMGDILARFNIVTETTKDLFIYSMIIVPITLFLGVCQVVWSRSKAYEISLSEFVGYSIGSLLMIAGFIWLGRQKTTNPLVFFQYLSYINIAIGSSPVVLIVVSNMLKYRRYGGAFKRSLATGLPIMIASCSILILFYFIQVNGRITSETFKPTIYMFSVLMGGIILFLLGCGITSKYVIVGSKTLWNSIRFSGGLTTLLIYTTLSAIGCKFVIGAKMSKPLIAAILINCILLILFTVYAFMSGRVKNLFKTNPLFNQIILKLFVICSALTGLVLVQILPQIYEAKSYGELSYAIMLSSSITILLGVSVAHFTNLIVYSKYFKSVIGGMIATITIILAIIFTISVLKFGDIIMLILSRSLVITFLTIAVLVESVLAFTNISYVAINLFAGNKKDIKVEKTAEEEEMKVGTNEVQ